MKNIIAKKFKCNHSDNSGRAIQDEKGQHVCFRQNLLRMLLVFHGFHWFFHCVWQLSKSFTSRSIAIFGSEYSRPGKKGSVFVLSHL